MTKMDKQHTSTYICLTFMNPCKLTSLQPCLSHSSTSHSWHTQKPSWVELGHCYFLTGPWVPSLPAPFLKNHSISWLILTSYLFFTITMIFDAQSNNKSCLTSPFPSFWTAHKSQVLMIPPQNINPFTFLHFQGYHPGQGHHFPLPWRVS